MSLDLLHLILLLPFAIFSSLADCRPANGTLLLQRAYSLDKDSVKHVH